MIYRKEIPPLVCQRQQEALNATICILQSFGPTGFLLQEENQIQKVKVLIASWQLGLNDIEITNLLKKINNKEPVQNVEEPLNPVSESKEIEGLAQRSISSEDLCPICQEEFLSERRPPVTFCRMGCGNNVHMKCMRLWKDHQAKQTNKGDTVSCPMCRGVFANSGDLIREFAVERERLPRRSQADSVSFNFSASIYRQFVLSTRHPDAVCCRCGATPLYGRVYKIDNGQKFYQDEQRRDSPAASEDQTVCEKCYKKGSEDYTKAFLWREEPTGRWRKQASNMSVFGPSCRSNDAWATTRPLSLGELSRISHWAIRVPKVSICRKNGAISALPHRILGLLTPGRQCRICLMHFQLGDEVRRLSGCGHIFHSTCVDPWLLHASPCCPLDKIFAAPPAPSLQEKELKLHARHSQLRQNMGLEPSLESADHALQVSGLHMNFGCPTPETKKNGRTREEPLTEGKISTMRTNSAHALSRTNNKAMATEHQPLKKTAGPTDSNPPPMEIGGSRLHIGRLPSSVSRPMFKFS
nr:unnamed protein product [Spirometra erinaceieuropaei]